MYYISLCFVYGKCGTRYISIIICGSYHIWPVQRKWKRRTCHSVVCVSYKIKAIVQYSNPKRNQNSEEESARKMSSGAGKIVCVTGASGYIASWLVKLHLNRGYTVKASVEWMVLFYTKGTEVSKWQPSKSSCCWIGILEGYWSWKEDKR